MSAGSLNPFANRGHPNLFQHAIVRVALLVPFMPMQTELAQHNSLDQSLHFQIDALTTSQKQQEIQLDLKIQLIG